MALIVTVGSASADSYITVAEMQTYLSGKLPITVSDDFGDWQSLNTAEKEDRLRQGALLVDSIRYRGITACIEQARAFPRLYTGDAIYPEDDLNRESTLLTNRYATWAEVQEAADIAGVDAPIVPQEIKDAQAEVTFRVVHAYLSTLDPMEDADVQASSLEISGLSMTLGGGGSGGSMALSPGLFNRARLSATTIVKAKLRRYLSGRVRVTVI